MSAKVGWCCLRLGWHDRITVVLRNNFRNLKLMKRSSRQRKTDAGTQSGLIERAQDAIRVARELTEERQAQSEKTNRFIENKLMGRDGEG